MGLDTDNKMSLLEYCVYHYKVDINTMMSRPQGVNEELEKAEAALQTVLDEIAKLEKKKAKLQKKAAKGGVKRKAQKSKNLNAMGKLWFIDREIAEAAKYKPKAN